MRKNGFETIVDISSYAVSNVLLNLNHAVVVFIPN